MAITEKKIIRSVCTVLALVLFVMFFPPVCARAVSDNDIALLQQKIEHLEEALAEQQTVIDDLEKNHSLIIFRKAALDQQININREQIELLEQQLSLYDDMIDGKKAELESACAAENRQAELFRARIRAMEERGNRSYLSFVFRATGLSDLLSRLTDVKDIMNYDKALEKRYAAARADVQDIMDEYSRVQKEQEKVRGELSLKEEQLTGQILAACTLIAQLDSLSADAAEEYAAIEKAEQEAWQEQLNALALLAAQTAAQSSTQYTATYSQETGTITVTTTSSSGATTTSTVSAGGLIWPTSSTYITSSFGIRPQPTAGASTNHQAVDIGGREGDPIYAAADGYVAVATYNDGLGYYILLQHDDTLSTRYSHLSTLLVSAGQYVTQGQLIGYMGSTGIATGSHLDYAVISNGEKVDPLSYYNTGGLSFDPTA